MLLLRGLRSAAPARTMTRRRTAAHDVDDVLWADVRALLGPATAATADADAPFQFREQVDVRVDRLSSRGDALAPARGAVIVVPFALPGEHIRVRVYKNAHRHAFADLVEVLEPNADWRDDRRVQCKYFGTCSGCQYQMLAYDKQLEIKRDVVVTAYHRFSDIDPSRMPTVLPTVGSPKQYHYRTKITPHFDAPPRKPRADGPKIGFNEVGRKTVVDIEECPIATPVLNKALGPVRQHILQNKASYKRGVSLLLRDSLDPTQPIDIDKPDDPSTHICITDHKHTVRERVGDTLFEFPGHAFFQNNNAILVPLTDYVRDAIPPADTHLVDTYCGSGLFAIRLSSRFHTVAGIELSPDAIRAATANAELNRIPKDKCTFMAGDAADIFATVHAFPRQHTAVIIDPPRKGCDPAFIDQLLAFGPHTIVYVSCNVHTQARDVGMVVNRPGETGRYVLDSLRGFDLFPQTAHVESVAVLRRVEKEE